MSLRYSIQEHRQDLQRNYDQVSEALDQNRRALEQCRGALWYIDNVLIPTIEDESGKDAEDAPSDAPAPPRAKLVE